MADVARLAGVSPQTVSRVLRNRPNVRPETRDRVHGAMRQLDYRPNSAARALVTGRSRTLVVVTPDTPMYGPAALLFSVEHAAREMGYFVNIINLKALDGGSSVRAVERIRDRAVDGVIVIAPEVTAIEALRHVPSGVPAVLLEGTSDVPVHIVGADPFASAARATRHLLDLGHPTVWHVAGPLDWGPAGLRVAGWRSVLEAAGIDPPGVLYGDWSARSGHELGQQLARNRDVSAVFVASDQMALGLLRAFEEAGRRAPADFSVVGFDDIPEARYFSPPLTTIRQNIAELGRRAVEVLLHQMDGEEAEPMRITVTSDLIVRESTRPYAQSRPRTESIRAGPE
jgi:DNA-binding LacI/PurR family transcriptional regulator